MGNRHGNKKLRAKVRARMGKTGESYQKALSAILASRATDATDATTMSSTVDLVRAHYFGTPISLGTFEIADRLACVVLSTSQLFPAGPFVAFTRTRACA